LGEQAAADEARYLKHLDEKNRNDDKKFMTEDQRRAEMKRQQNAGLAIQMKEKEQAK
jgi:hypothetical protein